PRPCRRARRAPRSRRRSKGRWCGPACLFPLPAFQRGEGQKRAWTSACAAAPHPRPLPRAGPGPLPASGEGKGRHREGERAPSVDVRLVAAFRLQLGDEAAGAGLTHLPGPRGDLDQRFFYVARHALGIAADVEVGAVSEPRPQLRSRLAHAVLHVDLGGTVTRPGGGEPVERAVGEEGLEVVAVEEVAGYTLVGEEEP